LPTVPNLSRFIWAAVLTGLCSAPALRGQAESTAKFEAADVHRSPRAAFRVSEIVPSRESLRAGRYAVRRKTMLALISIAYGIAPDKIFGGPNWLGLDQFDIVAKIPPSTPVATARVMLQGLLADRFKLVARNESRPLPAYALKVGKGQLKMKQSNDPGPPECRASGNGITNCRNINMAVFAQELHEWYGPYITDTLADSTGMEGKWDFEWKSNPKFKVAGGDRAGTLAAIDEQLNKQLGLALEVSSAPTEVLVIDRANETPTANPPGWEKLLPPPPTEFEVASIKVTDPNDAARFPPAGRMRFDPGRLEMRGTPMSFLIAYAFDIPPGPRDTMFAEAPKWIDSARFDIVGTTATGQIGPLDPDIRQMMRALLADRFKLVTHYEDRLQPSYTLVAVKPKLRKADPANRSNCKIGDDPRPTVSELITCQNITMPQFAEQLRGMALQYTNFADIEDGTGIKGAWDFSFGFSALSELNRRGDGPPSGTADAGATDPNGSVSFWDALRNDLGLKLEMRKRMMPMLVIDHIEEKPTDN
jgi:uncharacterized protein (TIGR03435 family)